MHCLFLACLAALDGVERVVGERGFLVLLTGRRSDKSVSVFLRS